MIMLRHFDSKVGRLLRGCVIVCLTARESFNEELAGEIPSSMIHSHE